MRKTKIVCTLGPACDNDEIVRQLVRSGLNVARFNFSHGSHEEQLGRVERLRRVAKKEGAIVALLLDTKGPEIRTSKFKTKPVDLVEHSEVMIRHDDIVGDASEFSCSYKELHGDVKPGDRIMIDDGLVELKVMEIIDKDIRCEVMNAGPVSDYKSINLPGVVTHLPSMTDRDRGDIKFAVDNNFDFIAASFIRKAADVEDIRSLCAEYGDDSIQIISKIENQEGVDNFEEILVASDGIMVARGDLGVEIPVEQVPVVQKMMLQRCVLQGKMSITATQMLDSMIRNPRPTRAEVSDVANAIIDGTGAIMLSGETASGKYPVEAVAMMNKIALETENSVDYWGKFSSQRYGYVPNVATAVSHAGVTTAMDLNATAILVVTSSGRTTRMISRFRPYCPIITTTYDLRVQRQLSLVWGTQCFLIGKSNSSDEMFELTQSIAQAAGFVKNGDIVIMIGGTPIGMSGTTNTLKVQHVGSILLTGKGIGKLIETGEVFVLPEVRDEDFTAVLPENVVLVAKKFTRDDVQLMRRANALISEEVQSDFLTEAASSLNIPVIINARNATEILSSGLTVSVDPTDGTVS